MARLASDAVLGYYPTPNKTLREILRFFRHVGNGYCDTTSILDPCCGEGTAIDVVGNWLGWRATTLGIELDCERAAKASFKLKKVVQGSLFNVTIEPEEGCVGLLWLNPPYGSEGGERYEMRFLKHSVRWLSKDGILVFLVPEHILENEKNREWIERHFYDFRVYRFHREEFPRFKQIVLFGRKMTEGRRSNEVIPLPPYPHIEDIDDPHPYTVPSVEGPKVFRGHETVTVEEVLSNRPKLLEEVSKITKTVNGIGRIKPVLPLRKGHLVAMLTAGFLDGRIETPGGPIWVKGYSDRITTVRYEDKKEITRNTYIVGIRVIEDGESGGKWYDIK